MSGATVHVCMTCKRDNTEGKRPGAVLYEALSAELAVRGIDAVAVEPVECLSVCKRPCTIALSGRGKWTYVIGDLDAVTNLEDIVTGAMRYAESANGIVPWRERPVPFRRGIVARVPPLSDRTAMDEIGLDDDHADAPS